MGEWQKITPPGVDYAASFVVDPVNSGVVYLGSNETGIYKTSDCGATWMKINTGRRQMCGEVSCAQALDTGGQWTFGIDHVDPKVLYTNVGYGVANGLMKSVDGGVEWKEIWPSPKQTAAFEGVPGFVGDVVVDPYDHKHVLLTFHEDCEGEYNKLCIGESFDQGETWSIVNGSADMAGAHESKLAFLNDSSTWVFLSSGMWRTANGGESWSKVAEFEGGGQLHRASNGAYYMMGLNALLRSDDGVKWVELPDTGNWGQGVTGDGDNLFASVWSCTDREANLQPYLTSSEKDGKSWKQLPTESEISSGALELHYDPGHKLLYSANCNSGFWRMRTK